MPRAIVHLINSNFFEVYNIRVGYGEQLRNLDPATPLPTSRGNKQQRRAASNPPDPSSPALPSLGPWGSLVPGPGVGAWPSRWEEEPEVSKANHSPSIGCLRGLARKRKEHQQVPRLLLAADSAWDQGFKVGAEGLVWICWGIMFSTALEMGALMNIAGT